MRAAYFEKTGAARDVFRIGEVQVPEPGAGEVRVRVHVSGVNPTDVKRSAGARGPMPFPRMIPGFDAAGVIESVGEGVGDARLGERVWVWEGQYQKAFGTAAEYVVVPASRAMALPESVSFEDGAALGVPALTAQYSLSLGGRLAGQAVLVTGGAGAVGNYAIQLARRMEAIVITTVSSDAKADDARQAGADHVVNYRSENVDECVLALTDGAGVYHMVDVNLAAHLVDAWSYVAVRRAIAAYGRGDDPEPAFPFAHYMFRNIAIRGVAIFGVEEEAKLAAAGAVQDALTAGALKHRTDRVFTLDEMAQAHVRQETGDAVGAVLVKVIE